jgi:IclR family KDG regulon transcriptional repressor
VKELKSSVQKTFAIIEHFTIQKPEWGVTELAKAIGSNKSTVYRFLNDLNSLGILFKHPDTEKYSLGIKLYELGSRVQLKSAFVDKTHPVLEEVAQSIKETVHIAVLKNRKVFYVDRVESPQGLRISSQIGSFNPIHATSLGKVLLAYLPDKEQKQTLKSILDEHPLTSYTKNTITEKSTLIEELDRIKSNGYAIDREEFEIGLICVGIPIFNQKNEVVASLSASGPANRFKEEEVTNYVATLRKGADVIQQKIGFFKP